MRQIIAMGGGGFSMGPEHSGMDRFVLEQTGKDRPRICFLPTASGDAEGYISLFYQAFASLACQPSHLSLFKLPTEDLRSFILEKDVVYVGGGNTRSMLALWREWQLDSILREAYQSGIVLSGLSAGGNCWFEQCSTDSMPGRLAVWPCLGFLQGSFCPHYDGEPERRPSLHRLLLEDQIKPGLAAHDSAAVHFVDEQLAAAITSIPGKQVFRMSRNGGEVIEEPLEMRYVPRG